MSFIRRGTPRQHPFPGADRPRTSTIRGAHPTSRRPAAPDDADTVVVDPPPVCEMLSAFVDGELDATAAQAFRDHLPGCSACDRDLLWQIQLQARISTLRKS